MPLSVQGAVDTLFIAAVKDGTMSLSMLVRSYRAFTGCSFSRAREHIAHIIGKYGDRHV